MPDNVKLHTKDGEKSFTLTTRTIKKGTRLFRWRKADDSSYPNYSRHEFIKDDCPQSSIH